LPESVNFRNVPYVACGGSLSLRVRLTPKGGRNGFSGIYGGPDGPALKAAVSAPPEGGKANAALIKLLSKTLKLPKGAFTITSGPKGRNKVILIAGEAGDISRRLDQLTGGEEPK